MARSLANRYPQLTSVARGGFALRDRMSARGHAVLAWAEERTFSFRSPLSSPVPYEAGDPVIRRKVRSYALMGFVGSALILFGASQPSSPFETKSVDPAAWFFGMRPQPLIPGMHAPPGSDFYISLATFYVGMVLLMRAWVRLSRLTREHPGIPVKLLVGAMCAWALPMLFIGPLLSQDAYSYVAQGEMMTRHISPYSYGPCILGCNVNSYSILTDQLWWNARSPYGPLFLEIAGWIQAIVRHSELGGLLLFRLEALLGVGLLGVSMPRIASNLGRDRATTFVFAVMNPIVIVHLIGGMHNDALMLGLLAAGIALAQGGHRVSGVVLVALAALVKVPAVVGIVYIGWDWLGTGVPVRRRVGMVAVAGSIALAVMAVVTQAVGIGWGWVAQLTNPDTVRSWLDPMTAIGLALAKAVAAIGLGDHTDGLLTLARGAGAVTAIGLGLYWLVTSEPGVRSMRALGLTMFVVVLLGPVMQPWYLAWGVVLLAPVATGYLRGGLVWLTVAVTFLGLGNASYFVSNFQEANPEIVAIAGVAVLALLLWPVVPRLRQGVSIIRSSSTHPDKSGAVAPEEVTAGL